MNWLVYNTKKTNKLRITTWVYLDQASLIASENTCGSLTDRHKQSERSTMWSFKGSFLRVVLFIKPILFFTFFFLSVAICLGQSREKQLTDALTPHDIAVWEANVGFISLIRAKPSTHGSSDNKNLPGCPSPTDSEVKRKQSVGELVIKEFAWSFIVFRFCIQKIK